MGWSMVHQSSRRREPRSLWNCYHFWNVAATIRYSWCLEKSTCHKLCKNRRRKYRLVSPNLALSFGCHFQACENQKVIANSQTAKDKACLTVCSNKLTTFEDYRKGENVAYFDFNRAFDSVPWSPYSQWRDSICRWPAVWWKTGLYY